jgi:hypothetical protein
MRAFCEDLKRNIVLGPMLGWTMSRGAVIDRLVTEHEPHPEVGKPRLWSHGAKDRAVGEIPWPVPRAEELKEQAPVEEADDSKVVKMEGRKNVQHTK